MAEFLSGHEDLAACTNNVYVRDSAGRFLERWNEKKREASRRLAKEGAEIAYALAPKRTRRMANTLLDPANQTSGTSGFSWKVQAPYWRVQEGGGPAHPITGMVNFWWEKEGRAWNPGMNWIRHPGNPGVHFMQRSYEAIKPRVAELMRD